MSFTFGASKPISIHIDHVNPAINLAVTQLGDDFGFVLQSDLTSSNAPHAADIRLTKDLNLTQAEAYCINITDEQIQIHYSDTLGAIYAIYRISCDILGFDPFWFWKQVFPAKQKQIQIQCKCLKSSGATFKYRGWFLNDEDLLTLWNNDGGRRKLDYPHYQFVTSPFVMRRVNEAALRNGCNLIIPGSFVNVMNPAEAKLVSYAAEHGLYVTQHHIEPLGVTQFSFEDYWENKGQKRDFRYATDPQAARETWQAYAQKWWDIAGEQTIWQLGLRGKGDRPIWDYDPTVPKEQAGKYISQAMNDQWQIIKQIDSRPTPPATTTLWDEGAQLMAAGELNIPEDITIIFSDKGQTQMMQDDFHTIPRDPQTTYGAYYHVGFWIHGCHLIQGTKLDKMQQQINAIINQGDTEYCIVNTTNIREHVMPLAAFCQLMVHGKSWDQDQFMNQWAPKPIQDANAKLLDCIVPLPDNRLLQDGWVWLICQTSVLKLQGKDNHYDNYVKMFDGNIQALHQKMHRSIEELDALVKNFPDITNLPEDQQLFFASNIKEQARMLATMYRLMIALAHAMEDTSQIPEALKLFEKMLSDRKVLEQGIWENWYAGETKEYWANLYKKVKIMIST